MSSSKRIKYGHIRGPKVIVDAYPIAASQAFKNLGGKFCKLATNVLDIADSGDSELFGWAEVGEFTSSATAGADIAQVNVSELSVYRLPADAAPATTIKGDTCDLIIASNIQQADIGESSEDVIQVLNIDITDVTVDVRMNPNKLAATGVA